MSTVRFFIAVYLLVSVIAPARSDALFLSLDFGLDNQTYSWTDSLVISCNLNPTTHLHFQNRSAATLIKGSVIGKGGDRWQKLARSRVRLTRVFNPVLSGGLEINQDFDRLEDRRFIGSEVSLFADLKTTNLKLHQKGGVVCEQRKLEPEQNTEAGFGYGSEVIFTPRQDHSFGRIVIDGNLSLLKKTPHKNIRLLYDLVHSFTKEDTTALRVTQEFAERKYFPIGGDYQATARQRSEHRRFDFRSARKLPADIYFSTTAAYRFVSYNYRYDQVSPDFIGQNNNFNSVLEYQFVLVRRFGSQLNIHCDYLFNRTKEDFGSHQINQRSETGQLALSTVITFSKKDTLELSGKIGVTSYFAPTTSSFFSDRDRTIRVVSFRLAHRFTPFLATAMDGSYRGFHTIYISGQLSANNNNNNVYILNPSLCWQPFAGIMLQQNYQLHASYSYYDYEKNDFSGRNTIYRRANLINTLVLSPSGKTDFNIEYSYRYEDFGPLRYTDQWQQQISWDRRTHRPKFSVSYHPTPKFEFQPYLVYEIQRSYDHLFDPDKPLGKREQSEQFVRKLIGFQLALSLSNKSYIDCKLQRRLQEYRNQDEQKYDLFTIALKRYL